MAHDVVDSRGRATSSRNGVTPGKGRYSREVLASRARAATKKYDGGGSSKDSYVDYVEERLRKLQEADIKNISLINSLLGDFNELNLRLESSGNRKLTIDEMIALRAAMAGQSNGTNLLSNPTVRRGASGVELTAESITEGFNVEGILTKTPEGTTAVIKPLTGDYEILEDEDGKVVIKLKSGATGAVYNEGSAIGSVSNVYMSSEGVDVTGTMMIDGKEVEVRIVADKTDWGKEFKELGSKAVSTVASTVASGVNTVIGFGKGVLEGGEYLVDGYLVGKSKLDSMLASGIGKGLEVLGIEGRRRISYRSPKIYRKYNNGSSNGRYSRKYI